MSRAWRLSRCLQHGSWSSKRLTFSITADTKVKQGPRGGRRSKKCEHRADEDRIIRSSLPIVDTRDTAEADIQNMPRFWQRAESSNASRKSTDRSKLCSCLATATQPTDHGISPF